MELRELPLVSLARPAVVTLQGTSGDDVTLVDLSFRDGAEAALADDMRSARPQAIVALFARRRRRGLEGDLRRFLGRPRVGAAPTPTRQ